MGKIEISIPSVHKIVKVVIDGIEYVPKEEKNPTQGLSDEQLINASLFEADEYRRKNDSQEKSDLGF